MNPPIWNIAGSMHSMGRGADESKFPNPAAFEVAEDEVPLPVGAGKRSLRAGLNNTPTLRCEISSGWNSEGKSNEL